MKSVTAALLSIAVLALVGCARPPPDAAYTATSAEFDAYRKGDRTALEAQIQALAALVPADRTSMPFIGCTPKGFWLRRDARLQQELQYLDNDTLLSMSEEAQFLYLRRLVRDTELSHGKGGSRDRIDRECREGAPAMQALDDEEAKLYDQLGEQKLDAWDASLRQSFGGQYGARMMNAERLLAVNAATRTAFWPIYGSATDD